MVRNVAVLATALVCAASAQAANLVHLYEFKGNFNDSIGSLALINNGATIGSIGSPSLTFAANQGPTLNAEASLAGNYSIGMRLSLDTVNGWRKLIDYKGLSSDMGSYTSVLAGAVGSASLPPHLQFVAKSDFSNGPTTIAADATMDVVFTRNGTTDVFCAYLNGSSTPQYTFIDTYGDAVATLVGGDAQFHFLTDDLTTLQAESGGGVLYQLRVWDAPLNASEIPQAFTSIPEPGTASIALIGLIPLARRVRQRS